jgi:hypothetical protein
VEIRIPANFTLDELLAATGTQEVMEGWYTAGEWAEHFGVGRQRMLRILKDGKAAGLVQAGKAYRLAVDDVRRRVSVYAFVLDKQED